MKKRIKIYKSPEEKEMFYRKFFERLSFQESLWRLCLMQQREFHYHFLSDDKKIMLPEYDFLAN